ncbi:MAG TPA: hypothetical protein VF670_19620 [Duganella sp.]|jgi:aryl carrier-like protein
MPQNITLSAIGRGLDSVLDELKAMTTPDREKIEAIRVQLDTEVAANNIGLHEWRQLVEKCARIRRSARTHP